MKFLTHLFCIVGLIVSMVGFASAQSWVSVYNGQGNGDDNPFALVVDGAKNVYVTGATAGTSATGIDTVTIKYSPTGKLLWTKAYNGTGNGTDMGKAIAVDASGNVYVVGDSDGGTTTRKDMVTLKYSSSGKLLWTRRYNGSANGEDAGNALALDSAGNVYVVGYSDGGVTWTDMVVIKYSPNGTRLWTKRYIGSGKKTDVANALVLDSAANVYVTGYSDGGATGFDIVTMKLSADGATLWTRRYNGVGSGNDIGTAIAVDGAGNAYVTGTSDGGVKTGRDIVTIKYDTNGTRLWVKRYDAPDSGIDEARGIAVDKSGSVYICGYSWGGAASYDATLLKYDSKGTLLWVQHYNAPGNGYDFQNAIALDSKGNIYVVGESNGGANFDITVQKYASDGSLIWHEAYNGAGNGDDHGVAIALDDQGGVYIVGSAFGGTAYQKDIVTLKYLP